MAKQRIVSGQVQDEGENRLILALRPTRSRRPLFWIGGIAAMIVMFCIAFISYHHYHSRHFSTLQQFSAQWLKTPEDDRHKLLEWLLGQPPARHTVYSLQQTRLAGLNHQQVEALPGAVPQFSADRMYYSIGSIEMDPVGRYVISGSAKRDVLQITFDQHGNVIKVETTS
ncbi:MAG: hypothetical protein IT445_19950 [Phycisphaeraceae bacterium]|nr:hypothetical protein [Phycisphaeraceae bacterium]